MVDNRYAITGFGISFGEYDSEETFLDKYKAGAAISHVKELRRVSPVDEALEVEISSILKNRLKYNDFVKGKKKNIRANGPSSYCSCMAVKEALKKAGLLQGNREIKKRMGIAHNLMYPVFDFGEYDGLVNVKRQWEQQSPEFIGKTFNIQGPQFVHREGENADLDSLNLVLKLIDTGEIPGFLISGVSMLQPTFLRVEILKELQVLLPHMNSSEEYILPTNYSAVAISLVVEDYTHARKRKARIWGEITHCVNAKFYVDWSNIHGTENSFMETVSSIKFPISTPSDESADLGQPDVVFGNFNMNFLADRWEYESLRHTFPHSKIVCGRKHYGNCPSASGLLDIALALWGFETTYFPRPVEHVAEVLNEDLVEPPIATDNINNIMVQSLSKTGSYTGVSIQRGEMP